MDGVRRTLPCPDFVQSRKPPQTQSSSLRDSFDQRFASSFSGLNRGESQVSTVDRVEVLVRERVALEAEGNDVGASDDDGHVGSGRDCLSSRNSRRSSRNSSAPSGSCSVNWRRASRRIGGFKTNFFSAVGSSSVDCLLITSPS